MKVRKRGETHKSEAAPGSTSLWVGLWGGGLVALERTNGTYKRVAHFENIPNDPSSLPSNDVGYMHEDRNGTLWIGTTNGLAAFDATRTRFTRYHHIPDDPTSLVDNRISGVYEDRKGRLWICTSGGLSQWIPGEPGHFKNFFHEPEDSHPVGRLYVSDILEDRFSNIWVATYGRGLNRLESDGRYKRFMHPQDSAGVSENGIYRIVEDPSGIFWLSTWAGLVSFDPTTETFTRAPIERIYDVSIFDIVINTKGELLLSTTIGLAKYNPKTKSLVRYDQSHGLVLRELRSGFMRDKRGTLLAGGLDGFVEFHPESLVTASSPPAIAITGVSVFDRSIPLPGLSSGSLEVAHNENFLSFSFAALSYVRPHQNQFRYKLEGADRDWVDAGTRNYVTYANLDPGRYILRVKACNSDYVWNEDGTSLAITILPPYWKTWWFRMLAAVLAFGLIYGAYRYRVRKLLEVERLRLRIAHDLHDDVGSNLSTIAMASRSVQKMPELPTAVRSKLAEIYETAITTSEGMKDIVWFIKPKNDTLDDLLLRMKDTASALLSDIDHEFRAPKNEGSLRISVDFKRNFFLAFKELLTNIVKHSGATRVEISIEKRDGTIEVTIDDNGRGFEPEKLHAGNGIASLRNRAASVGGTCEISSQPGNGTRAKFRGRL